MGRKIAQAESRAILGQIVGARIGESRAGRVLYVSAAAATLNFAFPPAQAGRQVLRVIFAVCFEPRKEETEGAAAKVDGC